VVQIFDNGELIATHGRRPAGKATELSHDPPEKIAFKMRTPPWCPTKTAEIGPACVEVITELLGVNALFRLRAAQGMLAPGWPTRPGPVGQGVRPGDRGRRPQLPHHQGHPRGTR
jgi:hypothetical protein